MTITHDHPTLPAHVFDRHQVDDAVKVYLSYSSDGWYVGPESVDGYPLDRAGDGDVTSVGECSCGNPQECQRARDDVAQLHGPTGAELIPILIRALVESYETHGEESVGKAPLAAEGRPWVVLRDALRADGSPLARHALTLVFGEA